MGHELTFQIEKFDWNPGTRTLSTNAQKLFGVGDKNVSMMNSHFRVQGHDHVVAFEYNPLMSSYQTMVFTPRAGTPEHLVDIQVNFMKAK